MEESEYKEPVSDDSNSKQRKNTSESVNEESPERSINDLLPIFIEKFSNSDSTPAEMIEIMEQIFDSNTSDYITCTFLSRVIEGVNTFLQYSVDDPLFKASVLMTYGLSVASITDFIDPLDDLNIIENLVEKLKSIPEGVSVDIVRLLKMISMDGTYYATKIVKAMGYDLLAELINVEHDPEERLQRHTSGLLYWFAKSDFDIDDFEDFGLWFLKLFKERISELNEDSLEYFMKTLMLLNERYGEEKWGRMIERSKIINYLWRSFDNEEIDEIRFIDFLIQVIKMSHKYLNDFDFDTFSKLLSNENPKVVSHTLKLLKVILENQRGISDYLLTEEFLTMQFGFVESGSFDIKKASISLLLNMIEKANGIEATMIAKFGAFTLLISQIEIYPARFQLKILHGIDSLLFFGQIRGEANSFTCLLEECDGISQLQSLIEDTSISSKVRRSINHIMNTYIRCKSDSDEYDDVIEGSDNDDKNQESSSYSNYSSDIDADD